MSVPTVIAIIGGIAFLIGIFGGGVRAKEVVIPPIRGRIRIFSTIIGAVLIIMAALLSSPELLNRSTAASEVPVFSSSNDILPTPAGQSHFSANFEGSALQGIGIYLGAWQIVDDGTGNHVFQIDNPNPNQWPGFDIGSSISDGIIEYRVKFLDFDLTQDDGSGKVNLYFRSKGTSNGYVFSIQPYVNRTELVYADGNGGWSPPLDGGMSTMFVEKNVWYTLRVELKGPSIGVYLDGTLLSTVKDYHYQEGGILLSTGPKTNVQVDDFSITYYEP